MTQSIPVTIYSESTPNPDAMKFVANMMLLPDGVREFQNVSAAKGNPFVKQIFAFSGVKSVFITANFITITKEPGIDWFDMVNIIREYIRSYIASGEKIFPINEQKPVLANTETEQPVSDDIVLPEGDVEQKIVAALDDYIRPAVEQDGGAIHFKSFTDGVVTVILKGSCSGCPSSTVTLKAGIENLLSNMIPEVKEVVSEEG
jgi:NFU1 iron-sulfur cluster scaffold homolog, mitochondrial